MPRVERVSLLRPYTVRTDKGVHIIKAPTAALARKLAPKGEIVKSVLIRGKRTPPGAPKRRRLL